MVNHHLYHHHLERIFLVLLPSIVAMQIQAVQRITRWWFQIFFIFTTTWGDDPIWRAYFSNGLKPPTSRHCPSIIPYRPIGKEGDFSHGGWKMTLPRKSGPQRRIIIFFHPPKNPKPLRPAAPIVGMFSSSPSCRVPVRELEGSIFCWPVDLGYLLYIPSLKLTVRPWK